MEITSISLTLKLSREVARGTWRGLELGAEASLAPNEQAEIAVQELYGTLRSEFARLWSANGNGKTEQTPTTGGNGAASGQSVEPQVEVAIGQHSEGLATPLEEAGR